MRQDTTIHTLNFNAPTSSATLLYVLLCRALKHENVLHLLGVCVDSPNMLIILEECANGDFKSFLKKKRPQMEAMKKDGSLLRMMIEMAQGLNYLHEKSIAHK